MNSKILLSSILLSSFLFAETPKAYIDMNYVWANYSNNGTTTDFKPTGVKWTGGYVVKTYPYLSVAVEGSAMLGVNSDTKSTVHNSSGATFHNADVSIEKMYSLNLKTIIPLSNSFNVNVYLGGTRGEVSSFSDESNSKGGFENSFSYGAGLEYWTPADVSVYANYMQYFKNLDAVEVGVGFRF